MLYLNLRVFLFSFGFKAIVCAGYPPKHVFPLTSLSLGHDVQNGVCEIYPDGFTQWKFDVDRPSNIGFGSVVFDGQEYSFIDVPMSIAYNVHFCSVNLYVKPSLDKEMSIFSYKSDDTSHNITSMELWMNGTGVFMDLTNSAGIQTNATLLADSLAVGQWSFVSFHRDQYYSHHYVELLVDTTDYDRFHTSMFASNYFLFQPGRLRIGGSVSGRDTFSGSISCVSVVDEFVDREEDNMGRDLYCINTDNWIQSEDPCPSSRKLRPSGHFILLYTDLSPNTMKNLGSRIVSSSRQCIGFCMQTSDCASVLIISPDKMCVLYHKQEFYNFVHMANTKYYVATSFA